MASAMKIVFGLLTFVTVGMILGALFQLSFIHKLEDSYGTKFPSLHKFQNDGYLQLPKGIPHWDNDREAEILRLGHGIKSSVRTSSGMFLSSEEKKRPMIQAIEKRISVYSQVPIENGELIQVLRYEKSQFYKPHHDYFSDTFNLKRGGQRVATMLMYLSDNVEGGETYFPMAGSGECNCGGKVVKGLSVKPIKGDAVLFWSMGLDGQSDPNSLHGGCEVLSGEKWSATKWMRQSTTS
ncbi:prolyl 4-hydroxylase 1 isoform X3 [Hevea brasiliensis]|uniref:prolyl 4-hydroxylase 1 isoform X3 n=1 Tax=Hevea brasiliensis TaxID=3981 RepID=UPI0025D33A8B|nr:prolyl 4-hydroxylase 1 isoform X3 [Hevea brasiliensis]